MLTNTPTDPFGPAEEPEAFTAAPGGDPFGHAAGMSPAEPEVDNDEAEAQPGHEHNGRALAAILREAGKPFDRAAAKTAAARAASMRRWDQKLDPATSVEAARLRAPCARWNDLDALALRRAGVWIMHADGFGFGVTEAEAEAIDSRDPARIPAAAREIVARLAATVGEQFGGPEADGLLVGRAGLIDGLPPID